MTPGGAPTHIDATLSLATLGGPWRDSAGNTGSLVFTTGPGAGPTRPIGPVGIPDGSITPAKFAIGTVDGTAILDGSIAAADVDTTQIQRRAGVGLTGGGAGGAVPLSIVLAGTGASAVARSDHAHAGRGTGNTLVGTGALTADLGTSDDTAVGDSALASSLGHLSNTAVGASALGVTSGTYNTAVGSEALSANSLGARNVAVGRGAHASNTVGTDNVALGEMALDFASAGHRNIGIGWIAGNVPTTGSDGVFVKSLGTSSDDSTTRIGDSLVTRAFVSGIYSKATALNDAVGVMVDGAGQLGTVVSSRRFKEAIAPLGDVVGLIQRLRPVSFRFRASSATKTMPVEFGLIAEEVTAASPELVAYDDVGQPVSVKYHVLPPLLVEEVRRLERERAALVERIRRLEAALAAR